IGICSIEEIGSLAAPTQSQQQAHKLPPQPANGNYGGPKVRDRLCQIIRHHQLDPNLVKSYATDYCGVKTLREAKREQVEAFVAHLADWAEKDRNALLSSSTAICRRKKVQHEGLFAKPPSCRSVGHPPHPGWIIPRPG